MKRSGFTLIEILIVMLIVGILFGLAFAVYGQSVASAREAATRSTILYIHRAVMARSESFARHNVKAEATTLKAQYDSGGNPSPRHEIPTEIARLLVSKNRFRAAFPQRLEDLFGIDGVPGTVDDSLIWAIWKRTCNANGLAVTDSNIRPTGHRMDRENCELLYLFLREGHYFGDNAFESGQINPRHLTETRLDTNGDGTADIAGNGLPEIVDDWGNPIRFYNWPTRLIRPGGSGAPIDQSVFSLSAGQFLTLIPPPSTPSPFPLVDNSVTPPVGYYEHPINNDPDDALGSLSAAQSSTGLLASSFYLNRRGTSVLCPAFNEQNYHTLDTYHAPLVISAGSDGRLGLVEPTEGTSPEKRNGEPLAQSDPSRLDELMDNVTVTRQ